MYYRSETQTPLHSRILLRWIGRAVLCFLIFSGLGLASFQAQSAPVNPKDLPVYNHANIFEPLSTPAHIINDAAWFVMWICLVIFLVVTGLIVYAMFKFRYKEGDDKSEPPQVYGSTQIELAWTVVPILITVILILVTSRTIGEIQNAEMPENAVNVRLVGHQWWWEVNYPDYNFTTANEIHVPISTKEAPMKTSFLLQSADVVHSFWVAQLNGKTDVVPNRDNHTWIDPTQVGIYLGNCAEFCGTQHANMKIRVVVQERSDFDAWVKAQQALPANNPAVAQGRSDFASLSCVNCHTIGGVKAVGTLGVFGPDLTHFASRQTLGSGVLAITPENVKAWLRDPQEAKPGCYMPNMQLSDQQIDDLTAYLISLE